jgi:hypothetical protein
MPRVFGVCLIVVGWLLTSRGAQAQEFAIDLEARAGKVSKTAHAEVAAPGVKPKERGILAVTAGDKITVQWTLRNADAKATFKDVLVHFVAVGEAKAGQPAMPKLDKDVAVESALTMDFKPKDATKGELSFTLDQPGSYLLRLETIGAAAGPQGHEYFAALDVVVK